MIYFRYAFRELQRHPGRWLISLLSVVIAVAAIVAVSSATVTTRMAYQQVFEALSGRADLEIVAHGGGHFNQGIAEKIREVPGTRAIVPVFHRGTIVYGDDDKAKALAVGFVPDNPESLAGLEIVEGKLPERINEIAIQSSLASALGLKVGSRPRLLTSSGLRTFTVSGIVEPETAARLRQGGMVLARLDGLQRVFRSRDAVDALQILLPEEADAHDAISSYARVLPSELKAQVPSSRSGLAEETLLLTQVSLNMASALSFTTAVFIVLSVFLMSVGERRQQLATMHAVGATRRQIVRMISAEAFLMGIGGTVFGIPLGVYGGSFLIRVMGSLLQTNLPPAPDLRWAIGTGAVVGPAICLLASWFPARRAARVSPLEGMRPVVDMEQRRPRRRTTAIGVIGLALSLLLALGTMRGYLPVFAAIVALIISLVATVLLIPALLGPVVALVGYPLRRVFGLEGEMSQRIVMRRLTRSSLTIGVLLMAVSASIGTGNAVFSITEDVRSWYERTITADFLLRPMMPEMTGEQAASMSESFGKQLSAMQGVKMVDSISMARVDAGGQEAMLVARDFSLYDQVPLDLIGGDPEVVLRKLRDGATVVGSVLAERIGVEPGDTLRIVFGEQSHEFPVAAIATEYTFGGSILSLDREVAKKLLHVEGVNTYLIQARPESIVQLEPKLAALADENGLLLQSFTELWRVINSMVTGVTGGLWVLLALGLVVGGLGVINTLTMNVLEQTREIGMLRAIGMRRRQIVKTVLGQAAVLGVIGVLAGAACGLSLARSINLTLGSTFGRYVPFVMRPEFVALLVIAGLAIVMLAAIFPARRAAQLSPIEAMRQE
ncbi:MAG: ABC transporter permease [Planctomycetota bacterium]|nr:MAG: ABC transporter permease [Planctomycetota bacterium]